MLVLSLDPQGELRMWILMFNAKYFMPLAGLPSLVLQYAQSTDHLKSMKDALRSGERWARTLQVMRGNGYAAWLRAIIQAVKICSGCQRG
jgi:hypothetical protein